MVDTIRTLAELNSLLGDNTTGDISAQDLRDVLASANVHTEIGGANISDTIGTTFVKIPLDIAGAFERGFVADTTGNQIDTTPVDLKAMISVEAQITALTASRTVDIAVFIGGSQVATTRRSFDAVGHYSWSVGVQLTQNDIIDLRMRADQASTAITLSRVLLRAQRIGVE